MPSQSPNNAVSGGWELNRPREALCFEQALGAVARVTGQCFQSFKTPKGAYH